MVIGLGFTLFFSGLIGWVGGASESPCLVRLFLFSVVVSMIAEIGGIISLNIVRLQVCICLGTIHILRQHNFGPFSDPPAHSGPTRQARFGPCLHFGFQYALIRNNWSKICWVEYWTLPGSNSLWRPCHYVSINTVLNFTKSGHFLNPPTKSF